MPSARRRSRLPCRSSKSLPPTGPKSAPKGSTMQSLPTTNKSIAIVQSNYIPWKGYFDMIRAVDEFILYDDVQYTRRDWRNRNRIKTPQGLQWLTIPVDVKGKYSQPICETRVADPRWAERHWKSIVHNYGRTDHIED